jgi:N-acetylneuraminate synthase
LGTGEKIPSAVELKNAQVMRRSIVAASNISAGTTFSLNNLILKRPGSGYLGNRLSEIVGKQAACDIQADTVIDSRMIVKS